MGREGLQAAVTVSKGIVWESLRVVLGWPARTGLCPTGEVEAKRRGDQDLLIKPWHSRLELVLLSSGSGGAQERF